MWHFSPRKARRGAARRLLRPSFLPWLEVLEDRTLLSTFLVTNTGDNGGVNPLPGAGTGTLRQAIVDANAAGTGTATTPDLIQFNIPTTDPGYNSTTAAFTIQPLSALPTVTDTLVLDGYSQPGATANTLAVGDNAVLNTVISGSLAGAVDGLVIGVGNSTVRGLVIDNFASGSGLVLNASGNDVVVGNFIGTDATGESAAANNIGINSNSPGDRIGGVSPGDRNIISGNNSALPDSADGGSRPADFGIAPGNVNLIEGNYIGTDKSGTSPLGNGTGIVGGSNSTIGGLTATAGTGAGNVVSGNVVFGIGPVGNQNLITGNLIGTTATGVAALGNGAGIHIWGNNNTIGGTTAGARNIISGNIGAGGAGFVNSAIDIENVTGVSLAGGSYNVVEGNYIGTDISGTTGLGPQNGIFIAGDDNTIGGTTAGARNIISGNQNAIVMNNGFPGAPSFGNAIQGNYIGTDFSGTGAVLNGAGVGFTGGVYENSIGGPLSGEGNLISGNHEFGIGLMADESGSAPTANLIQGNLIGTDKTGTTGLSNGVDGIQIEGANNNTIGGTTAGAGNTIAFNTAYGVQVDSGTGNGILGDSIFANSRPGILLNSANNANDNQAAPVLTGVSTSSSGTTISGTLQTTANTTFRIEFFASAGMDPSGDGQGQTYLGFANVTTNASGNGSFTATFNTVVPRGYFVSATATDLSTGDTSQFSKDLVVGSFLVTNTNDGGTGSLREAIYDANTLAYGTAANPDTIAFNIPANDPHHYYYRNDGVAGQVSLADIAVTTATSDSQIPDIDRIGRIAGGRFNRPHNCQPSPTR
jgi:titin